jgi:hypothetical protein
MESTFILQGGDAAIGDTLADGSGWHAIPGATGLEFQLVAPIFR